MRTSWKHLLSWFACLGITCGTWTAVHAGGPSYFKSTPRVGSSNGSSGGTVVKSQPKFHTGVVAPNVTTSKPTVQVTKKPFGVLNPNNTPPFKPLSPTTPTTKPPTVKPPFGVLNPGNQPPFKPLPPGKPPQVTNPIRPFPPIVTNPPIKPPVKPPIVVNPTHPFPPIGPIKPPVKPPIVVDPVRPFPPIGPVKPPVLPPIVVDPGHPFPPIGPIKPPVLPPFDPPVVVNPPIVDPMPPVLPPVIPPVIPPVCPPICPPPPHHCHPIWPGIVDTIINGGGYGPGPIVVQPYPIGGNVVHVLPSNPTVVTIPAPVAETTVQSFDLELLDVRFVDGGLADDQGPRYRVTVRNLSRNDLVGSISIALVASAEAQPTQGAQHVLGAFDNLQAGAMQTVDLRLPVDVAKQPQSFGFLTAAVAQSDGSADADADNNSATFDRTSIRDVNLRLDTIRREAGRLILVGEGFGPTAGKLSLRIGSAQHPVTTAGWTATEVGFNLPAVDAQGAAGAELQLIKADGRTGPGLEVRFAAK